jgi:hypothetical protein
MWMSVAACGESPRAPEEGALQTAKQAMDSKPDFVVTSVTGPTGLQRSQEFTANVTVCNQGTQPGGTEVNLYLSEDAVITPGWSGPDFDVSLDITTDSLAPGQCQTLTVQGHPHVSEGTYYLGASVDEYVGNNELIEDNNTLAGNRVGVGYRPDFVVTSVTGPTGLQRGQQFTANVTVCNQGTQPGGTEVNLYLSEDAIITPGWGGPDFDVSLDISTDYLVPGQCQTLTVQGHPYVSEGTYYLGAWVDEYGGNNNELFEDNNTLAGHRIGVGELPDFVVTSVTGPTSVRRGQDFTADVTVCNQGTRPGNTRVDLYLSEDEVITPAWPEPGPDVDVSISISIDELGPGQCQTVTIPGRAHVSEGTYYLGAFVDEYGSNNELFEDNNTQVGTLISVLP